jgi:NAD(P)-dependent dehydrogenase (short-subunit alcohol dehydrogenase family)
MDVQKVALVTASSAGLGAAIAKALIPQFRVVINYSSNSERASAVLDDLRRLAQASHADADAVQPSAMMIQADVSQRRELQHLVSETVATMGRLDVVVSNAGWTRIRKFTDLDDNVDEDDWDRCFNVNVKSHLFLLEAARDHLEKAEGAFITIASVAGVKPSGSSLVCILLTDTPAPSFQHQLT